MFAHKLYAWEKEIALHFCNIQRIVNPNLNVMVNTKVDDALKIFVAGKIDDQEMCQLSVC